MEPLARPPRPVPVLMYHDLAEDPLSVAVAHRPYVLTPVEFEAQMRALDRLGVQGVSLARGFSGTSGPPPGSPSFAVLTFDDGHASNVLVAEPILRRHGFSATFFVTASWIGRPPYMDWAQIRDLAAAGMEIGTHSLTHRPPATLSPAELDHEMRESRRILEDGLGTPVVAGSAPTGFHNPRIGPAARAAGYRALCISRIGVWQEGTDQFAIPRVPVKQGMSLDLFERVGRGDRASLRSMRARQMVRNGLKRSLGTGNYLRLRRILLGLTERAR